MKSGSKTYNILLEQYPNADDIFNKFRHITPGVMSKTTDNFNDPFLRRTAGIINEISFTSIPFPVHENIYPVLCEAIYAYLYKKNKLITSNYKDIISDDITLAENLALQGIHSLPDTVRQLCFFCTRLNQAEEYRIDNWDDLFNSYPLLKQRVESHVCHTLEIVENIFYRLENDKQALQDRFHIREFIILSLELFLGDFHQPGKSVVKVDFINDALIYKPRNANNEILISKMLAALFDNRNDAPGVPECISFDHYSWHQFIKYTTAKTKDELAGYYRKIGMSLAFFYCLNGYDFHYENIIYHNGTPYFIDMECVFTCTLYSDLVSNSVLHTFIIPTLQGSASDTLICGIGTKEIIIKKLKLEMSEQGEVYFKEDLKKITNKYNTPFQDNEELNINLMTEIEKGFDEMVALLREKKSVLLSLRTIKTLESRTLFRPTKLYADILSIANHPAYSSNPELRNMYLACALYNEEIPMDVITHEYLSLIDGRIPAFYVDIINDRCYSIEGDEIDTDNRTPSRKDFISKAFSITNDEEIELQKTFIDISLNTLFSQNAGSNESIIDINALTDFMITKSCHYKKNDIYLNLKREKDGARAILVMRRDVYSGLGGATFLQICNLISEHTTTNENKLKQVYETDPGDEPAEYFGGFDSNNGSMLYIEYLLVKHAPGFIDSAVFFRRLLRMTRIIINQQDASVDIISGIASVLIICCRMHTLSPCKITETAIKLITRKLLSQSISRTENTVTWALGWPGFSHGNAGITYALTLANNVLKDHKIESVIVSALKYEKTFRIGSGWNGLDLYNLGEDFNSWCHGAPGIYLSRVAMLNEMESKNREIIDMLNSDIEHYHNTKINRPLNDHHSLCHGMFGNAIIDPDLYGTYFDTSNLILNYLEEKSLMLGEIGAFYTNFYFSHRDKNIPNLLLLE